MVPNRSGSGQLPRLLVSVRNADEARIAHDGGADLIDVKEPANGSLGRASSAITKAIADSLGEHVTLSAALGELVECNGRLEQMKEICGPLLQIKNLHYLKWGLSHCLTIDWQSRLRVFRAWLAGENPHAHFVVVAYADANFAAAPSVEAMLEFACSNHASVLLIDTFQKTPGKNLLSYLSYAELAKIRDDCQDHGVQLALAGSLDLHAIARLRDISPDWFAVRGAVCQKDRNSAIDGEKVSEIVAKLSVLPATVEN